MNEDGARARAARRGLAVLAVAPLLGATAPAAAYAAQAADPASGAAAAPDAADLSVRAQAPSHVRPGAAVPFDVTVRNAGPARARHVVVTANLPDGRVRTENLGLFQWTSCTRSGDTLGCALGSLGPGEERRMRITLRPDGRLRPGTVLRAPVRVTSATRDPNLADNQVQATTTVGTPAQVKQSQQQAQPNQNQQAQPNQQGQQGRPTAPRPRKARDYVKKTWDHIKKGRNAAEKSRPTSPRG